MWTLQLRVHDIEKIAVRDPTPCPKDWKVHSLIVKNE